MTEAGYSGTPLPKKLGLKDGQKAAFIDLPNDLSVLTKSRQFGELSQPKTFEELEGDAFDYVHLFTKSADTVDRATPALRARIKPDGMIWMSWPKKASKVPTDVTEDTIRNRALKDTLVDVKVCAINDIWSGLKLVIRKEQRA